MVEKKTERPKFAHDKVAERHDMALVYSAGYATEALHELLDTARAGNYQIFTWHDADPDGYNIVRNLREATKNMPVAIEVIDLGLTVEQALDLGLASEPFAEDRKLGAALISTLNDVELEYFVDRKTRFEINSIPSATRIAYVERLLAENGARPKYVPPDHVLRARVKLDYEYEIEWRVEGAIARFVDKDSIVTLVTEALRQEIQVTKAADLIRDRFEEEPATTWDSVVDRKHSFWARHETGRHRGNRARDYRHLGDGGLAVPTRRAAEGYIVRKLTRALGGGSRRPGRIALHMAVTIRAALHIVLLQNFRN
ncbi:MAG TPA: hypothetical protein VIZ60_09160 [Rubrobacter sp.]